MLGFFGRSTFTTEDPRLSGASTEPSTKQAKAPSTSNRRPLASIPSVAGEAPSTPGFVGAGHPFANVRVTGRVSDAVTGAGISGATVEVSRDEATGAEERVVSVTSGPDGQYVLLGIPPGRYQLLASASGYHPMDAYLWKSTVAEDVPGPDLALRVARVIRGRVLDAMRRPVAGAKVQCSVHCRFDGGFVSTAVDGRFVLDPVDIEPVVLLASKAGVGYRSTPALAGIAEIEVVLESPHTLRGHVVADGQPVAGASVSVTSLSLPYQGASTPPESQIPQDAPRSFFSAEDLSVGATSGADGRFSLELPAMASAVLRVAAQGFQGRSISVARSDTEVIVELSAAAHLAGEVRTSAGAPAEGAQVRVKFGVPHVHNPQFRSSETKYTTTDIAGRFIVNGLPRRGPYDVGITFPQHQTLLETVASSEGVHQFVLVEEPKRGWLCGRVVDATTRAPITRLQARVGGEPGRTFHSPSGSLEFDGLEVGNHRLEVSAEGYVTQVFEPVRAEPERPTSPPEFRLSRAGVVTGRVVGAGTGVVVIASDRDDYRMERAGADGSFRFAGLPAGTWELVVDCTGDEKGPNPVRVDVRPGVETPRVALMACAAR